MIPLSSLFGFLSFLLNLHNRVPICWMLLLLLHLVVLMPEPNAPFILVHLIFIWYYICLGNYYWCCFLKIPNFDQFICFLMHAYFFIFLSLAWIPIFTASNFELYTHLYFYIYFNWCMVFKAFLKNLKSSINNKISTLYSTFGEVRHQTEELIVAKPGNLEDFWMCPGPSLRPRMSLNLFKFNFFCHLSENIVKR